MRISLDKKKALSYLKSNWFSFFAVVVFLFFTFYYMGPGFSDCKNSIYGFGDSTAGPIWRNSLQPEQPLFGGPETKTNYPYGESLYSPVGFAASVQTVSMWLASKVVGPVCAYNVYNIVGYVFTAVIMYLFILYLTKNKWIALLAGYAVSFTPYVQSKIGGHPNYAYAGLLVAIIWLMFHLITYRKVWTGVLLGVAVALCAYLDPYFVLLAATVIVPVLVVWLVLARNRILKSMRNIASINTKRLIPIALALLTFFVLLTPLAVIRIKDAGVIENSVGKSRGNVVAAAQQCSNPPLDYLLPDPTNMLMVKLFGQGYTAKNVEHRNWCGYAESRVSLSLTLICIAVLAAMFVIWEKLNRHKNGKITIPYGKKLVLISISFVGVAGFLLGLPPYINDTATPTAIILQITEMWRIFAREYLVVNLALVVLASLSLHFFANSKAFKNRHITKGILFGAILLGVLLEYQINYPFSPMTFNYSRDIPSVYKSVEDDASVNVIAEYPMDRIGIEYDSVVYYMTMQGVHMKSMINSVLATDSRETTHASLKDLSDPQTIPALRYLKADRVIVHGERVSEIISRTKNQLQIVGSSTPTVYALTMVRDDDIKDVVLTKPTAGAVYSNILTIEKGGVVNLPLIQSPINTEYEILNGSVLRETKLGSEAYSGRACFDVKMSALADTARLDVYKNGVLNQSLEVNGTFTTVGIDIKSGDSILLKNSRGFNMRLDNLNGECNA